VAHQTVKRTVGGQFAGLLEQFINRHVDEIGGAHP
jgi:hypothetical protein